MQTGSNLHNAESSRFAPAQPIGSPIPSMYAVPPNNWQLCSSSLSLLLNSQPGNSGGSTALPQLIIGSSPLTPVSGKNVRQNHDSTGMQSPKQAKIW
jgi:hypothetical protein